MKQLFAILSDWNNFLINRSKVFIKSLFDPGKRSLVCVVLNGRCFYVHACRRHHWYFKRRWGRCYQFGLLGSVSCWLNYLDYILREKFMHSIWYFPSYKQFSLNIAYADSILQIYCLVFTTDRVTLSLFHYNFGLLQSMKNGSFRT